jgi:hypothetical protein
MELIYTKQRTGFEKGKFYRNPEFFRTVERGVTKVTVIGDYPAVVEAYQAVKVDVDVQGGNTAPAETDPSKMNKADLQAWLTSKGIQYDPAAKVPELKALIPAAS